MFHHECHCLWPWLVLTHPVTWLRGLKPRAIPGLHQEYFFPSSWPSSLSQVCSLARQSSRHWLFSIKWHPPCPHAPGTWYFCRAQYHACPRQNSEPRKAFFVSGFQCHPGGAPHFFRWKDLRMVVWMKVWEQGRGQGAYKHIVLLVASVGQGSSEDEPGEREIKPLKISLLVATWHLLTVCISDIHTISPLFIHQFTCLLKKYSWAPLLPSLLPTNPSVLFLISFILSYSAGY